MHTPNHDAGQDPDEPLAGRSVFDPAPQPGPTGPGHEPTIAVAAVPAPASAHVPAPVTARTGPTGPTSSATTNSRQRVFIAGAALAICSLLGAGVAVALADSQAGGNFNRGEPSTHESGDRDGLSRMVDSPRHNVDDPGTEPSDEIYPVTGPTGEDPAEEAESGDPGDGVGSGEPIEPGDELYPITGPEGEDPGEEPEDDTDDPDDPAPPVFEFPEDFIPVPIPVPDPGPQVIDPWIVLMPIPDPDPGQWIIPFPVPTTTTLPELQVDF